MIEEQRDFVKSLVANVRCIAEETGVKLSKMDEFKYVLKLYMEFLIGCTKNSSAERQDPIDWKRMPFQ